MSKKIVSFLFLLIFFTFFIACPPVEQNNQEVMDPLENFFGKWKGETSSPPYDDWFEFKSNYDFYYYNNGDPTNDLGYAGKVVTFDLSGDIYFLNLKITNRGSWDLTTDWYARIYLKKDGPKVKEAIGVTGIYPNSIMVKPTINEARNNFTIENGAYQYIGTYIEK